jgi:hypothetical protein
MIRGKDEMGNVFLFFGSNRKFIEKEILFQKVLEGCKFHVIFASIQMKNEKIISK